VLPGQLLRTVSQPHHKRGMTQPVEMVEEARDGTGDAVDARLNDSVTTMTRTTTVPDRPAARPTRGRHNSELDVNS